MPTNRTYPMSAEKHHWSTLPEKTLVEVGYKIALINVGQKTLPNINYKIALVDVGKKIALTDVD